MRFIHRVCFVSIGVIVGFGLLAGSPQTSHADTSYAWGWNNYGQLGDGTNTNRTTPVAVSGLSTGVTAGAGGRYHSRGGKGDITDS